MTESQSKSRKDEISDAGSDVKKPQEASKRERKGDFDEADDDDDHEKEWQPPFSGEEDLKNSPPPHQQQQQTLRTLRILKRASLSSSVSPASDLLPLSLLSASSSSSSSQKRVHFGDVSSSSLSSSRIVQKTSSSSSSSSSSMLREDDVSALIGEDCLNKIQRYELSIGSCDPTQCGGIGLPLDSVIVKAMSSAMGMMHAGSSMHLDVDGKEIVVEKIAGTEGPDFRFRHPCCEEAGNICCQPCMELLAKLFPPVIQLTIVEIPAKESLIEPFLVDPNTLQRMGKMWDMFIADDKNLAKAEFPRVILGTSSERANMLWFPENMAEKIGNFHLRASDWIKLVEENPSEDKRLVKPMTTNEKERRYMSTTWVPFLPTVAFLELDPNVRKKVHLLGHEWYEKMTGEGKLRRKWTTKNAQEYFNDVHEGGRANSLKSWQHLLDADAVIHILIYGGKHFSSVSVFNLTSCLLDKSLVQTHRGCFLGIDFLKCHPLLQIVNNIAM